MDKIIKTISITWNITDVIEKAKELGFNLTNKQASEILQIIKNKHDCNEGINWIVIQTHIEMYMNKLNK